MNPTFAFFLALALSLALVPFVRRFAVSAGLINMPRRDRWDSRPVALLGGVAIFASYTITWMVFMELTTEQLVIFAGGLIMFGLGLLDDIFRIAAGVKILVQCAVALGLTRFGIVSQITSSVWLDMLLTLVWIVGMTNALNLLDNMDGLSSGLAIVAAIGIFGLSLMHGQAGVALMCVALVGSCLGFLKFNFKPARIHMGDCGSLFLGYILAVLALMAVWRHNPATTQKFLAPVLVLGVAVFDTTLVSVLRLANHRMPWCGGRDHSSHRLAFMFDHNEKHAVLTLYGIGILAGALGLALPSFGMLPCLILVTLFFTGMIALGVSLAKISCDQRDDALADKSCECAAAAGKNSESIENNYP